MFSLSCLAIFALIATAVALPASEKPIPKPITTITSDELLPVMPAPWFSVPYFGDITKIFAPLWKFFPSFEDLGPRINIEGNKFQVIVPVKDYSKDDLKVKVKQDLIFVQGLYEAKEADRDVFASQFFHTYTLPANSSGTDVTAELTSDGYLVVNAPTTDSVDRSKETDRDVPIVETGVPFKKEETASTEAPEKLPEIPEKLPEIPEKLPEVPEKLPEVPEKLPEASETQPETLNKQPEIIPVESTSESEIESDQEVPTTPLTDREEIVNVIPHGNEIDELTP
ncbi:Small heat shock protein [Operophtera brumata]|uniref:Small heat shock protein n=1 Tax=Operophtera brumata TaxID=104452 RepID=A0A0L7L2Q4_OPEBR|nr:Small heat shock protein [Operophtera brumata]